MVNQVDPLLVSVNDGAKILGLGRSKFYELVAEGKIELVKVGRKSLAPVSGLKAFADTLTNSTA